MNRRPCDSVVRVNGGGPCFLAHVCERHVWECCERVTRRRIGTDAVEHAGEKILSAVRFRTRAKRGRPFYFFFFFFFRASIVVP